MALTGTKIELPSDVDETLEEIFQRAKKLNPALNRQLFLNGIITMWLDPYIQAGDTSIHKDNVKLRNNLKEAITLSGKTQAQVAKEIGISKSYLTQVVKGVYDPSIALALVILRAINYPPEKIKDVFYLEPVGQE